MCACSGNEIQLSLAQLAAYQAGSCITVVSEVGVGTA